MNTGMLWFDNDPKTTLKDKIIRAADYYRKKYGRVPNTCLINPDALSGEKIDLGILSVRPYRPVLPGHFLIGFEEKTV